MLSQHIEATGFGGKNIVLKAVRCGGKKNAVRIVALIQKAVKEIGPSVKRQPRNTLLFLNSNLAQSKVALNLILARLKCEPDIGNKDMAA